MAVALLSLIRRVTANGSRLKELTARGKYLSPPGIGGFATPAGGSLRSCYLRRVELDSGPVIELSKGLMPAAGLIGRMLNVSDQRTRSARITCVRYPIRHDQRD